MTLIDRAHEAARAWRCVYKNSEFALHCKKLDHLKIQTLIITMTDNPNPGNFHNRPHEEVENIARKGGQSSHRSGFASMDTSKQVSNIIFHIII